MKAVVCTKYGPPEVLQLKELPKPTPKPNQVLIKIHTSAVTASDVILRGSKLPLSYLIPMRLILGVTKPRKGIIGFVLAGEIQETGKNVTRFKVGDQVYGFTALGLGAYAEYKCMPEKDPLALKPHNMNYEDAAAIPYGGGLALHFLKKGNIQRGQKVLIYGASGAIGTLALQLAKYFGAEVTGVCSTSNLDMVKSLGADEVIDYTQTDSIPQGTVYDFIFDAVGKQKSSKLKESSQNALTPTGKYISVDDGTPQITADSLAFLTELAETGHLKTAIDRCYPLEQIVEAHRNVDLGHKKGNVVITIN